MEFLVLSILILINGLFALSEIALVSSKKSRLERSSQNGSKGAKIALKLLDDSENFLSAIQVGITLIGIVTGMYGGLNIADDITPFFQSINSLNQYAYEISLTITVVIITFVSIVIGELVPKTIALSNPEKIAIKVAPIIYYFSTGFYPFVKILSFSTSLINRLLGIKKQSDIITEAEIIQLIKNATKEGIIEKDHNLILEKVFYFADKKAKHIMTRRKDVDWINLEKSNDEIKRKLFKFQHSKIICCKGNLDNFVGIVNLNSLFKSLAINNKFDLNELIYQPVIIPENLDAKKILTLMRSNKTQICCVINEYGAFEGIITLHDIIEHIVGQMPEEGETLEPHYFVREDNSILINGYAPIETFNEIIENFDLDFEKIDYSSVAGFITNQLGKIPSLGDSVDYMGYRIEIVDLDGNIIDKVLINKID